MTLSVVLATYNGEKFIREQLDSILAQTLLPDEIIVSDDESTDKTWEILREYQNQYPSLIRLYRNTEEHGPHKNFIQAFRHVTCDYVAPCDQDDIWMPEKLERSVAALDAGAAFAFCQETMLCENGQYVDRHHTMPTIWQCIFGGVIPGHLIVCRKELLGVFTIAPTIPFDEGLTIYASLLSSAAKIDYIGCVWRRHASVCTSEFSEHCTSPQIEDISKWIKFLRTMCIIGKHTSDVIRERQETISHMYGSFLHTHTHTHTHT